MSQGSNWQDLSQDFGTTFFQNQIKRSTPGESLHQTRQQAFRDTSQEGDAPRKPPEVRYSKLGLNLSKVQNPPPDV